MCQHSWIAGVGRLALEFERTIGGRLKVVGRFELTVPFLHEQETRVGICEIEFATPRKHGRNDMCPNPQIRQPANSSPRGIDKIERPRGQAGRFIHPAFQEVSFESASRLAIRIASAEKSRPLAIAPSRIRRRVSVPMWHWR